MARILDGEQRSRRPNPDLFGQDIMELAELGLGMAAAGFANDKIVAPLTKGIVPGGASPNNTMGQLVDAGTTIGAAWLVGEGVSMVNKRLGRTLLKGGMIYGIAKGISAFVPGYSLSAQFPTALPSFGAHKQLAAGSSASANTMAPALAPLGVGTMGF